MDNGTGWADGMIVWKDDGAHSQAISRTFDQVQQSLFSTFSMSILYSYARVRQYWRTTVALT